MKKKWRPNCPRCGTRMNKRQGAKGDFFYCRWQYRCGQKPLSIKEFEDA